MLRLDKEVKDDSKFWFEQLKNEVAINNVVTEVEYHIVSSL